jgi:hypothetical protein
MEFIMSVKNISSASSSAHELTGLLRNSVDPFENNLNRTIKRVAGLIVGSVPGIFLADALVDLQKYCAIHQKVSGLEQTRANDSASQRDLEFQKKVYAGIGNYTQGAGFIKAVTGAVGTYHMIRISSLVSQIQVNSNGQLIGDLRGLEDATQALGTTLLTGLACAIVHKLALGSQLKQEQAVLLAERSHISPLNLQASPAK